MCDLDVSRLLKVTQQSNKNEKSVSFFLYYTFLTLFVKICFYKSKQQPVE